MKEGNINQSLNQPLHEPDETALTLWMDGELEGEALHKVEQWAQKHPELLAERDAIRAMNTEISEHIPSHVEPPYPEFFNQQILRQMHNEQTSESTAVKQKKGLWQWLTMPAVAIPVMAAAMALCFTIGTQYGSENMTSVVAQGSSVYTPDGGVSADMFQSTDSDSLIIVLDGLDDIPDDVEIVALNNPEWSGNLMAQVGRQF